MSGSATLRYMTAEYRTSCVFSGFPAINHRCNSSVATEVLPKARLPLAGLPSMMLPIIQAEQG
jgi:hypothetical protein